MNVFNKIMGADEMYIFELGISSFTECREKYIFRPFEINDSFSKLICISHLLKRKHFKQFGMGQI